MSNKLKLTKLEIKTKDGKRVSLTMEEAKELYDQLHELYGERIVVQPYQSIVIERDRYPWTYPGNPIWCWDEKTTTGCYISDSTGMSVSHCFSG